VEAVIRALIHVTRIVSMIGFQRLFVSRPAAGQARVERAIVSNIAALILGTSSALGCWP